MENVDPDARLEVVATTEETFLTAAAFRTLRDLPPEVEWLAIFTSPEVVGNNVNCDFDWSKFAEKHEIRYMVCGNGYCSWIRLP